MFTPLSRIKPVMRKNVVKDNIYFRQCSFQFTEWFIPWFSIVVVFGREKNDNTKNI